MDPEKNKKMKKKEKNNKKQKNGAGFGIWGGVGTTGWARVHSVGEAGCALPGQKMKNSKNLASARFFEFSFFAKYRMLTRNIKG